MDNQANTAALQWYLDHGVDEALSDNVIDRYVLNEPSIANTPTEKNISDVVKPKVENSASMDTFSQPPLLGASDARAEAVKLANSANTLEELKEAIAAFDGIGLKKTATNLVFCDGNPKAKIMLIGEAPGADEDRLGKPFVGVSGQLLDRIFSCIGLDRSEEDSQRSFYISNILNWRPPGNRTPAPGEIEASLPFIERHIQLINPEILIFCGGVSAKALLGRSEGISKLRKTWHSYKPQTQELSVEVKERQAIATFHPAYLLRTPNQKKAVWADMLEIQAKMQELNI